MSKFLFPFRICLLIFPHHMLIFFKRLRSAGTCPFVIHSISTRATSGPPQSGYMRMCHMAAPYTQRSHMFATFVPQGIFTKGCLVKGHRRPELESWGRAYRSHTHTPLLYDCALFFPEKGHGFLIRLCRGRVDVSMTQVSTCCLLGCLRRISQLQVHRVQDARVQPLSVHATHQNVG